MEIKNSLYTFDSDFDILPMCNMFLENKIALTENGSHATFVCPVQIKVNGTNISIPSAFNICYLIPNCSGRELTYFSMVYNREISKMLNKTFPDNKFEENASIILNGDNLLSVSFMKHCCDTGIVWHSIFIDPPNTNVGFQFDKLPVTDDNKDEKLRIMHNESVERFQLLRNHILMSSITLSQSNT